MPSFGHEIRYGRHLSKIICGVDEAGRGPLAGPVIAAAAIIPLDFPSRLKREIKDSKKLSFKAREDLYSPLTSHCRYAIGEASVEEIQQLNILWATMLAMQRCIESLSSPLDVALIDGNRTPKLSCTAYAIIGGDDLSYSIAAASIIAKVHRDRIMKKLAEAFPHYGWERNAGYGTKDHLEALDLHGATQWHRMTFAPVRLASKHGRILNGGNPTAT